MRVISGVVTDITSRAGLYSMELVADHGIEVQDITTVYLWLLLPQAEALPQLTTCTNWKLRGNVNLQRPKWPYYCSCMRQRKERIERL